MTKEPRVSIIILNWNGLDDTIECLESLKKITYNNYEVIVVDNASSGNDVSVLKKKFGKYISVIENDKNYGFAEGNNIAIRRVMKEGKSKYVLLLNNDTVVDPHFLDELVKTAECDPKIGIVGPKIYYYDEPDKIWLSGGKINLYLGKPNHYYKDYKETELITRNIELEHITGCAFLIKKELFEKIGIFDKMFFCYLEETDFCFRARKLGYRIFWVGESKIWHKISRSSVGNMSVYYLARNRLIFMANNSSFLHMIIFMPYQIFFKSLVALPYFVIREKDLFKGFRLFLSFTRGLFAGIKAII